MNIYLVYGYKDTLRKLKSTATNSINNANLNKHATAIVMTWLNEFYKTKIYIHRHKNKKTKNKS